MKNEVKWFDFWWVGLPWGAFWKKRRHVRERMRFGHTQTHTHAVKGVRQTGAYVVFEAKNEELNLQ